MSIVTGARPLTRAETVLRDIPMRSAKSVIVTSSGSRYISFSYSPGMNRFLVRSICPSLVIIPIVHDVGVSVLKSVCDSPLPGKEGSLSLMSESVIPVGAIPLPSTCPDSRLVIDITN